MTRDIIVIGGSAGALEPLKTLVGRLPAGFPGSIFVVVHLASDAPSVLAQLLDRAGPLPARVPGETERIEPGVIYVAPSDRHLLIEDGHVRLGSGPRENRHRPAIDPLFRSAARAYGSRVVGVVLSGLLDDGASGSMAVKMRGGLTVVQDPAQAAHAQMPEAAIRYADPDHVLAVADIASLLAAQHDPSGQADAGKRFDRRDVAPMHDQSTSTGADAPERNGTPSVYACPDCHGVLWEHHEGEVLRFRCRIGHAYTAISLAAAMSDATEDALWTALRALEEKASLLRRLGARAPAEMSGRYQEQAQAYDAHAEKLRDLLERILDGSRPTQNTANSTENRRR